MDSQVNPMEKPATKRVVAALNKLYSIMETQHKALQKSVALELNLAMKLQDSIEPGVTNISYTDKNMHCLRRVARSAKAKKRDTFIHNDHVYSVKYVEVLSNWYFSRR